MSLVCILYGTNHISEVLDHILDYFQVVAAVSLDRWHHHSCFYNGRDWCALNRMNNGRGICCWTWETDLYSRTIAQSVWWRDCGRVCYLTVGRTDWRSWSRRREVCDKPRKCCFFLTVGYTIAHTTGGRGWSPNSDWHCWRAQSTVLTLHLQIFTCLVLRKIACRLRWRGTEERNASVAAQKGKQLYQTGMLASFQGGRRLSGRWRPYSLHRCCSKVVWNFDTLTLLMVVTSVRVLHVLQYRKTSRSYFAGAFRFFKRGLCAVSRSHWSNRCRGFLCLLQHREAEKKDYSWNFKKLILPVI